MKIDKEHHRRAQRNITACRALSGKNITACKDYYRMKSGKVITA
jgi:hypothetical protein